MQKKQKILIVDDEMAIRNMLDVFLSSRGHDVLTAQNAREAINLIERRKLDLLLLDIHMPEVSGEELLNHLRTRERIGGRDRLPVLVVSGTLTTHLVPRLVESGADGLIVKPLDLLRIIEEIERILDTAGRGTKPGEEKTLEDILEDPTLEDMSPLVSRLRELGEQIEELDNKLGEPTEDERLMSEAMSVEDYTRKIHRLHLGLGRKQLQAEYQDVNAALSKIKQGLREFEAR